jgi:hypothetical protein
MPSSPDTVRGRVDQDGKRRVVAVHGLQVLLGDGLRPKDDATTPAQPFPFGMAEMRFPGVNVGVLACLRWNEDAVFMEVEVQPAGNACRGNNEVTDN